jgi:hypothetical protein
MKFRQHRGSLQASMETVVELADKAALIKYLRVLLNDWNKTLPDVDINFPRIEADSVHVKHYAYDERTKWETHIVVIDHYGPVGFTDGPCE